MEAFYFLKKTNTHKEEEKEFKQWKLIEEDFE